MGTYLFVDEDNVGTPVTRFVDIGGFLQDLDKLAHSMERPIFKLFSTLFSKVKTWNSLRKHFHEDRAPKGLTFSKFLETLQGLIDKKYGREKTGHTYKTLMVAGMHFMDSYNYDVERVKRCVIHYAAPDGLLYPFCAYNAGPTYRERIEKKFSVPFEHQLKTMKLDVRSNGHSNGNGVIKTGELVGVE